MVRAVRLSKWPVWQNKFVPNFLNRDFLEIISHIISYGVNVLLFPSTSTKYLVCCFQGEYIRVILNPCMYMHYNY